MACLRTGRPRNRGSIPGKTFISSSNRPHRLWGPLSLFNGHRVRFPGNKTAWGWSWLLNYRECQGYEWVELYLHFPYALIASTGITSSASKLWKDLKSVLTHRRFRNTWHRNLSPKKETQTKSGNGWTCNISDNRVGLLKICSGIAALWIRKRSYTQIFKIGIRFIKVDSSNFIFTTSPVCIT